METQNLSTNELKKLITKKKEALSKTQINIEKLDNEHQYTEDEIDDLKKRLIEIEDELDQLDSEEQKLLDEIDEIEAILESQTDTKYSKVELENGGQSVIDL